MPIPTAATDVAKVRAFVIAAKLAGMTNRQLAELADGVDEKTVRLAAEREDWNPLVGTLMRMLQMLPKGWQPGDAVPQPKASQATKMAEPTASRKEAPAAAPKRASRTGSFRQAKAA